MAHKKGTSLTFKPVHNSVETTAIRLRDVIRDYLKSNVQLSIDKEALQKVWADFVISPKGDYVYIGPPLKGNLPAETVKPTDFRLGTETSIMAVLTLVSEGHMSACANIDPSQRDFLFRALPHYDVAYEEQAPNQFIFV